MQAMTVARGVRIDVRRALAIAVMGLAGAVGTLVLMLWLAGSTSLVEVKLGDADFRGMDAARLSAEIADNGPVPFPDLAGRDRPLWLAHAGDDPSTGWAAFFATVPPTSDGQTCLARWDGASSVFVDSCDPTTTWPPDGHGLAQLDWQVVDGELRVAVSGTRPADWEARP
ncbi:MAG: hypothetical protein P8K65_00170 [Acidimicrobiales bacterium]|jgi:hypothetical protein|nr:hypothetical protein [Acidimicrobiaceae bacterium]MDG2159795.1 hypothetical protein [Acidimicrobiales bacterium]